MKHLHYRYCIAAVALAAIALVVFGISANTLGFLAVVLLCPVMMLVMMRMMVADTHQSAPPETPVKQDH